MKIQNLIVFIKKITIKRLVSKFRNLTTFLNFKLFYFIKNFILQQWHFTYYCKGDKSKLKIGKNVSSVNTLYNTSSGCIYVGDNTIFGHNVMVLTGFHEFLDGKRKSLITGGLETPTTGYDIRIGKGCWIASGVIISGNVTIGDNVIIGAGAVVTKDIPDNVFAAGVPAKIKKKIF